MPLSGRFYLTVDYFPIFSDSFLLESYRLCGSCCILVSRLIGSVILTYRYDDSGRNGESGYTRLGTEALSSTELMELLSQT